MHLRCEFAVVQNLVRYAGQAMDDKAFPAIYYVFIVLGCMMPWTVYLPGALARTFPRRWRDRARDPAMLFGWLAVLVPLAFFMAGRTRLAIYVLPVAPPLAAMIAIPAARWVASHHPDRLYRVGTAAMRVAVVAIALTLGSFEMYMGWLDAWFALPMAAGLVAVVLMTLSLRRARRGAYLAWATAGTVATLLFVATHTAGRVYAHRSVAPLGRIARARAGDDDVVCYFGKRRNSFALYANRTEARRFCRDLGTDRKELARLLQSGRHVYCLVEGTHALRQLRTAASVPLTVLGTNGKFLLVTNEPPGLAQMRVTLRRGFPRRPRRCPEGGPTRASQRSPASQSSKGRKALAGGARLPWADAHGQNLTALRASSADSWICLPAGGPPTLPCTVTSELPFLNQA
ncbi:MAG: hypothetical protein WBF17_21740 [Phycisphaerae bacterium]